MSQSPLSGEPPASSASSTEPAVSPSHATICTIEPILPLLHEWTAGEGGRGYPIVDKKYFNVENGQVVALGPDQWMTFGPPSLDIYWQNRRATTVEGGFSAVVRNSTLSMTDYVIRVGEFLKDEECSCVLQSLTATTYSVNVIVFVDMSHSEMRLLWKKYGL